MKLVKIAGLGLLGAAVAGLSIYSYKKKQENDNLKNKLESAKEEIEDLLNETEDLKEEVSDLTEKYDDQKKEINSVKKELAELIKELKPQEETKQSEDKKEEKK